TDRAVKAPYLADVPGSGADGYWGFEGSRPAVVGGVPYEAMGGVLQATDAETGEAWWIRRYPKRPNTRSLGSVAVAGPAVVVSTRDGQVFGLDVDTGYTLGAYDLR